VCEYINMVLYLCYYRPGLKCNTQFHTICNGGPCYLTLLTKGSLKSLTRVKTLYYKFSVVQLIIDMLEWPWF